MRKKIIATVIGTSALAAVTSTNADAVTTYKVKSGDSLWSIANKYNMSVVQQVLVHRQIHLQDQHTRLNRVTLYQGLLQNMAQRIKKL